MNDQGRILNIFLRLFFGEKLQKKSLADEFEVNERTIQRDLSFLRYFVSVHSRILGNLVYNRDIKKYSIDRPSTIEKQEVLFISKILLENRALNKNEFNILLAHTPFYFDEYEKWGADLTLCGHVHGGIVRLPLVGGLLSPDRKFFPKYDLGEYIKNKSTMIVSKGLGGSMVLIRVNCKPEIVNIKLKNIN